MEFKLVAIDGYHSHGSGVLKQERSDPLGDDDTRVSKMGKRADDLGLRSNSNNNNNSDKQQMLSFSSSNKPEVVGFLSNEDFRLVSDKNGFSFYNNSRTSTGFGSGNMNGGMNGSFTGIKGPFTPAQWIELEHQAMIYKYFTANVPVPSNLLIPIKKAIQYAGFTGFSIGSFPSHAYGWGSFHLGFSGNSDPEPGRCRRTDGKKWRCSRDAVPDQKYCERHINRGRHRSRKPVEGHTGQAASGATTTKVVPPMSSTMPSLVTPGGGVPNGIATAQHQIKGMQPAGASYASVDTKRLNDKHGLSMMPPPTANMESKDSQYPIPKHMEYDESSVSEFGIVSNDSLLNPSQKSSYVDCKRYNSMLDFNAQKNQEHNPLQHFTDNWPINPPHPSTIAWPKDPKSDWTQLSMSIPMSTDFSSSSSSPNQENLSPSRLSRELEPSHMGLGVEIIVAEEGTKENSWIPIAYGNSMGGPLGEVLLSNSSAGLDNDEQTWDGSPQDGSSPTGILQKSTFVSISNNNSGGSPLGLV